MNLTEEDKKWFTSMVDTRIEESEIRIVDRVVESMRKMQTELLRGFQAFSSGQAIRVRKLEADQSNLDTALSGRVAVVENRLMEIELRLGTIPPPLT